jgi:hypothetical protein
MNYVCPNCNSDNIQAFRVAYENGASVSVGKSTGVGVGFSGGGIGVGVGSATNTTASMSLIAQKMAPPRLQGMPGWFKLLMIVSVVLLPLAFVLWFTLGKKIQKENKALHDKQMAAWERSWLCFKCGNAFAL